jgi:hypothetical protein
VSDHKIKDNEVAVSTDYFWDEDMSACPVGVKVQLLNEGGVAIYGRYSTSDTGWRGWAPLPKKRKNLK